MNRLRKGVFLVYSLNVIKEEPSRIRPAKPLYFSTQKEAESFIRSYRDHYNYLYDEASEERVYCLILEEYELDSPYRYQLSTRVFSADGLILSECTVPDDGPFLGRPAKSIKHVQGDIVEIPYGEHLVLGIVVEQPLSFNEDAEAYGFTASDDCYTIIQHPGLELNYAHSPMVFKPSGTISEQVRATLVKAYESMLSEGAGASLRE